LSADKANDAPNAQWSAMARRFSWITACMLGEALGIAVVASTYAAIDRGYFNGALWIVAAGGFEGLSLGLAQALVLRRSDIAAAPWTGATLIAAMIGYGLSLLGGAGDGGESVQEPALWLLMALGAGMGVFMGAVMGAVQWLAARRTLSLARWTVANAVGWAPAMALIMIAATSVSGDWPLWTIALVSAAAGCGAGLCVGAVTSAALPAPSIRS
jgi:hypothetical protein